MSGIVPAGWTISEAAKRSGLSTHTLRYYERDDLLLAPIARTSSGHRVYSDVDLRWIAMLTRLRATGMPIADMKQYAALARDGDGNEAERLALLCGHRLRVLAHLDEVTGHLGAIDRKVAIYTERVRERERSPQV